MKPEPSVFSYARFIAYAIPTGPSISQSAVGAGTYLGNDDQIIDIEARISVLKNAVDVAKAAFPVSENDAKINNIFLAPEFFFHGTKGPYIYSTLEDDPLPQILSKLTLTFNRQEYPNWTFIFGTALTAHVVSIENVFESSSVKARNAVVKTFSQELQNSSGATYELILNAMRDFICDCQASPNIIVRDRALIVSNILMDTVTGTLNTNQMLTEKYFLSEEDFILSDPDETKNVVTEQMVGYAHIDLSGGDEKKVAFDKYAIFRQNVGSDNFPVHWEYGVEICLDHDDARLRNNLKNDCFKNGDGYVNIQLVPSYGSQIVQDSVVADRNGFVFNCDGQASIDSSLGAQQGKLFGVQSVYVNYGSGLYGAHSQLAQVDLPAIGNDPNRSSARFQDLTTVDICIIPVPSPHLRVGNLEDYFAGGSGAIHIYGMNTPYALNPSKKRDKMI